MRQMREEEAIERVRRLMLFARGEATEDLVVHIAESMGLALTPPLLFGPVAGRFHGFEYADENGHTCMVPWTFETIMPIDLTFGDESSGEVDPEDLGIAAWVTYRRLGGTPSNRLWVNLPGEVQVAWALVGVVHGNKHIKHDTHLLGVKQRVLSFVQSNWKGIQEIAEMDGEGVIRAAVSFIHSPPSEEVARRFELACALGTEEEPQEGSYQQDHDLFTEAEAWFNEQVGKPQAQAEVRRMVLLYALRELGLPEAESMADRMQAGEIDTFPASLQLIYVLAERLKKTEDRLLMRVTEEREKLAKMLREEIRRETETESKD